MPQMVPIRVPGDEQHHRARALLEQQGLVTHVDTPGGMLGPAGLVYGFTQMRGAIWVPADRIHEALALLHDAGLYAQGPPRPIVDRADPRCPNCEGVLNPDGPAQCGACGLEFDWVDVDESMSQPTSNVCHVCGYDLRYTDSSVCPECGREVLLMPPDRTDDDERAPVPPRHASLTGSPILGGIACFVLVLILIGLVNFVSVQTPQAALMSLAIGVLLIVAAVFVLKYVMSRRAGDETDPDRSSNA